METLLKWSPLLLSIGGWIVVYLLTIRAQNKNFLNQVTENARISLMEGMKDYQMWLGKVIGDLRSSIERRYQSRGYSEPVIQHLRELLHKYEMRWAFLLEEYESLFPKTREVRRELLKQHMKIISEANEIIKTNKENENLPKFIENQMKLIQDLRIYLQNKCLSSFTGHKVPKRNLGDSNTPRIFEDKDGILRIREE